MLIQKELEAIIIAINISLYSFIILNLLLVFNIKDYISFLLNKEIID